MTIIDDLLKKGKLKQGIFSDEMYQKEYSIAKKDLDSAKTSFDTESYKWATIQAYYAIFHAVRALIFKSGYRDSPKTCI